MQKVAIMIMEYIKQKIRNEKRKALTLIIVGVLIVVSSIYLMETRMDTYKGYINAQSDLINSQDQRIRQLEKELDECISK